MYFLARAFRSFPFSTRPIPNGIAAFSPRLRRTSCLGSLDSEFINLESGLINPSITSSDYLIQPLQGPGDSGNDRSRAKKKGQGNVWQGNKPNHVFDSLANHSSANDFAGRTLHQRGTTRIVVIVFNDLQQFRCIWPEPPFPSASRLAPRTSEKRRQGNVWQGNKPNHVFDSLANHSSANALLDGPSRQRGTTRIVVFVFNDLQQFRCIWPEPPFPSASRLAPRTSEKREARECLAGE